MPSMPGEVDDALSACRIDVSGRGLLEDRPAVLVTLTPIAEAGVFAASRKFPAEAWIVSFEPPKEPQ